MKLKGFVALLLGLSLLGCSATHQIKFNPWQGLSELEIEGPKRGLYPATPQVLFEAVAKALEREPFLNWEFEEQEASKGWIKANGGLFRLLQARISVKDNGLSELSLSLPRRTLDGRTQVWKKSDGSYTAYSPSDPQASESIEVVFELDEPYLYSLIHRQLKDQSPVPFELLTNPAMNLEK